MMGGINCQSPEIKIKWYLESMGKCLRKLWESSNIEMVGETGMGTHPLCLFARAAVTEHPRLCLKQQKSIFSQCACWKSKVRVWLGLASSKASFLACRRLPSHCTLTMVVLWACPSLMSLWVEKLPTIQDKGVRSLGQEDPWRRKVQRSLVGYCSKCHRESDMSEQLNTQP